MHLSAARIFVGAGCMGATRMRASRAAKTRTIAFQTAAQTLQDGENLDFLRRKI